MSLDEVRMALRKHKDEPITEIHSVGGIHPRLPYSYDMDLLRVMKDERPIVHVKAFAAVEIAEIARVGKVTMEQALRDLIEAVLDSLPGGGIEILSDRVFFFQAEDGIRDKLVTGVQTCALPIFPGKNKIRSGSDFRPVQLRGQILHKTFPYWELESSSFHCFRTSRSGAHNFFYAP